MNLSFERIGVITGAVIGIVTVGGFLGYGLPWYSKAAGADLATLEEKHHEQAQQTESLLIAQILQNGADTCDGRAAVLVIQARAAHSPELKAEADKTTARCSKLHDQADDAQRATLPH